MDSTTGLVIVGLLILGAALFSFLLSATILWGATKLLKFKEASFKKSMKVVGILWLIMTVAYAMIFGLSMLIPSEELLVVLLILAGISSLVILAALIKTTFKETWTKTIITIIIYLGLSAAISVAVYFTLIIPVVMWQLGVFNVADSVSGGVVVKDWVKIQPLMPTIMYNANNQKFDSTFINVAGTSIQITDASVNETYSGVSCSPVLINGAQITAGGVNAKPGSPFTVSATCTNAGKKSGDQYLMMIHLKYTAVIGGITTTDNEDGTIRGNAENSYDSTDTTIPIEPDSSSEGNADSGAPENEATIPIVPDSPNPEVPVGWNKLQPLTPTIAYRTDGSFEATFQNSAGTTISVQSVKVAETITHLPNGCTVVSINDYPWTDGQMSMDVETGKLIKIAADCSANSHKDAGDPFNIEMTFKYITVMGEVYTAHTETGHIRGPVEA